MAAEAELTPTSYIQHHLQHLRSQEQTNIVDFSVINYDTLFWSIAMGVLGLWLLRSVAKRASAGVPGRLQAAVESLGRRTAAGATDVLADRPFRRAALDITVADMRAIGRDAKGDDVVARGERRAVSDGLGKRRGVADVMV